jgi:hypothetical protein
MYSIDASRIARVEGSISGTALYRHRLKELPLLPFSFSLSFSFKTILRALHDRNYKVTNSAWLKVAQQAQYVNHKLAFGVVDSYL